MNDSGRSGVQNRELAHTVTMDNPLKRDDFDHGSIATLADAFTASPRGLRQLGEAGGHLRGQSTRVPSSFTRHPARQDAEEGVPSRRLAPGISCP